MHPRLRSLLSRAPAVTFLDCDGVIYDTNRLKCDAYRHALADAPPERVEALVAEHLQTGGVSRFVKLRRFFEVSHPVPDVEGALAQALTRFGEFCEGGYARLSPRPEALAFATAMGGPDRVYVVSGGAEEELRAVFARALVADRFAAILGSPRTKREHLATVLDARGLSPGQALFVGDGWGDWDATRALGVPFVFLAEMSEWSGGRSAVEATPTAAVAETWEELLAALLPG